MRWFTQGHFETIDGQELTVAPPGKEDGCANSGIKCAFFDASEDVVCRRPDHVQSCMSPRNAIYIGRSAYAELRLLGAV